MKRLKKDIKGMTLIEVVVSLLIISTASLIMVQGFVTVNRLFYESNQYNETTANVRAALIPDENGDVEDNEKVKVKREEATSQIYFYKNTENEVLLQGSVFRATSKQFSDNQLRSFTSNMTLKSTAPDESTSDVATGLYKSYCRMTEEIKEFLVKNNRWDATKDVSSIKKDVRNYLLQYTSEEQLKNLGIDTNTNLAERLGEIYIARYYPNKSEMPAITKNTAKALGKWNDNIYSEKKEVYPGTNGENYCYPTLMPTYTKNTPLNELFDNQKYKDYIFITLYNHSDVELPNNIQAIYNNNSQDIDEWYVFDKLSNGEKNMYGREDFKNSYSKFSDFISKYQATRWQIVSAEE